MVEQSPPHDVTSAFGTLGAPPSFYQDPTALTDKAIEKAVLLFDGKISAARELLNSRIDGVDAKFLSYDRYMDIAVTDLKALIEARLAGMDTATKLFHEQAAQQLLQLKMLHQEKFDSIKVQFEERDTRTEQTAAGVKIAVDAALQAAKEAVAEQNRSFALATGKSETATMKQIDALGLAIQTANKGLDDKIADMKDRLTRIEGMDLGSIRSQSAYQGAQTVQQGSTHNMIAIIAVICAAVAIAISLFKPSAAPPLVATVPANPPVLQRQQYIHTQPKLLMHAEI